MFRLAIAATALIGMLAATHSAFADPAASCDHARSAAPASEQLAPPQPAKASSPDATAPASAGIGKDIVPVGFGWG
jgi:hypothetical protein